MITVSVQLKETSQPIRHEGIVNTYQKGDFYCVYDGTYTYKYPIPNIWRIKEEYGEHQTVQEKTT